MSKKVPENPTVKPISPIALFRDMMEAKRRSYLVDNFIEAYNKQPVDKKEDFLKAFDKTKASQLGEKNPSRDRYDAFKKEVDNLKNAVTLTFKTT